MIGYFIEPLTRQSTRAITSNKMDYTKCWGDEKLSQKKGFFSWVPFCLRPIGSFERCALLQQNKMSACTEGQFKKWWKRPFKDAVFLNDKWHQEGNKALRCHVHWAHAKSVQEEKQALWNILPYQHQIVKTLSCWFWSKMSSGQLWNPWDLPCPDHTLSWT